MANSEKRNYRVDILCGEKIRYSFVSHLLAALRWEGISVLVNEDNLDQDSDVGVRVSIVIFSENHGFSTSVLDKFVKGRNNDHMVVPVFYGVHPSEVNLGNLEWRNTTELGNFRNNQSKDSELVKEIVRDVYRKLSPTKRIGIDSRLLEIENLLCDQPWNVRRIGIWGMPGIGKTTLAKAMFDKVSIDYDASLFIENFDEAFRKQGPHRLVKEIIGKVIKEQFQKSSSYVTRSSLLRDKLRDKRILVVLDGVGDPLAAESFLGRLDWIGPGSLIIMTSTDKQVFAFCEVNQIYEVQGLNKHEALELFSQIAFGKDLPDPIDMELSMKVIEYANGSPLALCTFGHALNGKESKMEIDFLKLKQCPPLEIHDVLKSAFNALSDNEKNILLDISCFFGGENVDYVAQLLEGCRYIPRVGIDVLAEKCLVAISNNTVQMHTLIQNAIVETSNGEAVQEERCTRLWEPSSIRYLLEDDETEGNRESKATTKIVSVAEDIESILLDVSDLTFNAKPDAFKNMFNLRFLKIYSSCSEDVPRLIFPRGLDSLPRELRLLHWENYPLRSLPNNLDLDHLVELSMPYSQLETFGSKTKKLGKLKRIRLCDSQRLVEFCIPLYARNLELIDLQGCKRLHSFADASQLQHLRVINLSGCRKIISFPAVPPNLEELYLQGTRIDDIPTHIKQVKLDREKLLTIIKDFPADVKHIDLESLASSLNQNLGKLVHLNMRDCFNLFRLPDMRSLEDLQFLDLSGCSKLQEVKSLPRNIKELNIAHTAIQELPQLPQSLELLNAHGCKHLKSVLLNFEQLPRHYTFSNCFNLSSQVINQLSMKGLITRVTRLAREHHQEVIKTPAVSICVPAKVDKKASFLRVGSNLTIEIDPSTQNSLLGFAMAVMVFVWNDYDSSEGLSIRCECTWETMNGHLEKIVRDFRCWAPKEALDVIDDHIFFFYDAKIHLSGKDPKFMADKVTFNFYTVNGEDEVLDDKCTVTKCGVQAIKDPTDDDPSHSEIASADEYVDFDEEFRVRQLAARQKRSYHASFKRVSEISGADEYDILEESPLSTALERYSSTFRRCNDDDDDTNLGEIARVDESYVFRKESPLTAQQLRSSHVMEANVRSKRFSLSRFMCCVGSGNHY